MVLKIKEYTDEYDCVDERFNGQFFQKHLGLLSRYDDFFICGPPSMNKSIPVVL
jgi:NAD(P)H-flavin reductase